SRTVCRLSSGPPAPCWTPPGPNAPFGLLGLFTSAARATGRVAAGGGGAQAGGGPPPLSAAPPGAAHARGGRRLRPPLPPLDRPPRPDDGPRPSRAEKLGSR